MNRDLFNNHQISVHRQFETNPLYPEDYEILKNHFLIKKTDLKNAGWCDVRFKVHNLAYELAQEGYIPIQYTNAILEQEIQDLINEDLSYYQTAIIRFSAFSTKPPLGKRLIMQFIPCLTKDHWEFRSIYSALNNLLCRDITREEIVYYLSKSYQTVRHPAFFRAVFKQWLDIKNKRIYDLCPDWGFKALSVLIEGGKYYCNSPHIQQLTNMGEFLGGKVSLPNQEQYDLIILSDVFPVVFEEARQLINRYSSMAEYLMITIDKNDRQNFIKEFKPWRVIRLNNEIVKDANSDNYLMIIHQK